MMLYNKRKMEHILSKEKKELLKLPLNTDNISVFSGFIENKIPKKILINYIKDIFIKYFKIELKNEDIEINEECDKYIYLIKKYEIHLPDLLYLQKNIFEYFNKNKDLLFIDNDIEFMNQSEIKDDKVLDNSDKISESSEELIEVENKKSREGYFYLIHIREFIISNQSIYKLGKTTCIKRRFTQYPKNSKLIFSKKIENKDETENHMKHIFKKKFNQRLDIGTEYYEGDIDEIICVVNKYFNNELVDELNDYIYIPKKKYPLTPRDLSNLFIYKEYINKKILNDFLSKDINLNTDKYIEINNLESINDIKTIYIKYDYSNNILDDKLLFIKDMFSIEKFIFKKIVDCSKYTISEEAIIFYNKWFDNEIRYKLLNNYFYHFKDNDREFIDFVYKNKYEIENEKYIIINEIEKLIECKHNDFDKIIFPENIHKTFNYLKINHDKIHTVFKLRDRSKKEEQMTNEGLTITLLGKDNNKTQYCIRFINKIFQDFNGFSLIGNIKDTHTKNYINYRFNNLIFL